MLWTKLSDTLFCQVNIIGLRYFALVRRQMIDRSLEVAIAGCIVARDFTIVIGEMIDRFLVMIVAVCAVFRNSDSWFTD